MYKHAIIFIFCQVTVHLSQGAVTNKKPAPKDVIKSLAQRCAGQFQLPPEKASLAFKDELPQNENETCYFQCMYEGVRIISDAAYSKEGAMQYAKIIFPKPEDLNKAIKVINECDQEVEKDTIKDKDSKDGNVKKGKVKEGKEKCGLGEFIRNCFVKNGKQVNFFPHS